MTILLLAGSLVGLACDGDRLSRATEAVPPTLLSLPRRTSADDQPTVAEIAMKQTLRDAVAYVLPHLVDDMPHAYYVRPRPLVDGVATLSVWARLHMEFSFAAGVPDSSPAMLFEAIRGLRGSRACVVGRGMRATKLAALDIVTMDGMWEGPTRLGERSDSDTEIRIRVVGPVPSAAPQQLRACGILVGRYEADRARGIVLVGLFDTPEARSYSAPAPLPANMEGEPPQAEPVGATVPL